MFKNPSFKSNFLALQLPRPGAFRCVTWGAEIRSQEGRGRLQHGCLPAVAALRLLWQRDGEGAVGAGWGRCEALRAASGHHSLRLGPGKPRVWRYPIWGWALWPPQRGSAEPRLRGRRVLCAVYRGPEGSPALGMRQLSTLACTLFKKKPKPPLDVLVLRGCSAEVFAVALPGVSKRHADSCMIGDVGVGFFCLFVVFFVVVVVLVFFFFSLCALTVI